MYFDSVRLQKAKEPPKAQRKGRGKEKFISYSNWVFFFFLLTVVHPCSGDDSKQNP